MRDTLRERERESMHVHREREKQTPPPSREPDAGLDPRTLGSHPEPKAGAQPLSPPDAHSWLSLRHPETLTVGWEAKGPSGHRLLPTNSAQDFVAQSRTF